MSTFKEYITEKAVKPKPLSGYDYYKSIRKPVARPGSSFKDKSKYSRKEKHTKSVEESLQSADFFKQVSEILSSFGMKAFEQDPVLKIVQKAMTLAYNEGYKAGTDHPFKNL